MSVFCAEGSVARPTIFESLEAGDVLFLDSSHTAKIGSDDRLFPPLDDGSWREPLAEEGFVDERPVIHFSHMHSLGAAR